MECFRRDELLDWETFQAMYGTALRDGTDDYHAVQVLQRASELGEKHWDDLRKRVIEHVSSPIFCVCRSLCTITCTLI